MKKNPRVFLKQIIKDEYYHLYDDDFYSDLNQRQK